MFEYNALQTYDIFLNKKNTQLKCYRIHNS